MVLPSKKVFSVFVLIIALVAAIIIAFGRDKSSSAINYASNLVIGEKISIPENPNWQGELGNTLANTEIIQQENATSSGENSTDIISQSLMANYLALKQSGKLNSASAQKLIDQTINLTDQLAISPVSSVNLNIVPDNGKQSIMDYGENLGDIIINKKPTDLQREIIVMTKMVQLGDKSSVDELDGIITGYKNMVGKLVKMPVPKTFSKSHLELINGANGMIKALTDVKNSSNDPFKSISALQLYQNSLISVSQVIQATISFIKQNNVIYKQGSSGYYLLYEI